MGLCKKVTIALVVVVVAVVVPPLLVRERITTWSVRDPHTLAGAEYDYVVVGTGPAGCVAASFLGREGFRTLVLEQGGPDHLSYLADPIRAPSAFPELRNSSLVRILHTAAQEALGGRSLEVTHPVVAGGGGTVGWSLFVRGSNALYDAWAALGCPGWAWEDMTTFWRMAGGTTDLTPAFLSDVSRSIMGGAAMAGFKTYHSPGQWLALMQRGFGTMMTTAHVDERSSPIELLRWTLQYSAKYLDLVLHSKATRVLFDGKRAIGVEFENKGELVQVFAKAEVILSAGAIGSPSLLVASGIGPAATLEALGVPQLHNLNGVGAHLQDHVMVPIAHNLKQEGTSIHSVQGYNERLSYSFMGDSLVGSNLLEVGGLTSSSREEEDLDIMFFGGPMWFVNPSYTPPETETSTHDGVTLLVSLSKPRSSGLLRWTAVGETPTIDPMYLSVASDMETLLEGVKLGREIMVNAEDDLIGDEEMPGLLIQSDEELKEYIRNTAMAGHDFSGTCKMGAKTDDTAVVDHQLRVHGIQGLRIADLSICPAIPNGNGIATATMIGAKLADMIIEQEEPAAEA